MNKRLSSLFLSIALGFPSGLVFGARLEAQDALAPADEPELPRFAETWTASHFLRGNLHTHTTLSDGTSTPERTINWYRTHGYDFLALTDHNLLSKTSRYAPLQEPGFVLIPGEEVTMKGHGRQVHVNALCTNKRIPGGDFPSAKQALASAIGQIDAQGGVALVNHPNFDWALTATDIIGARAPLLEIASGHPYVHTAGDARRPSHERLWDIALSEGVTVMGAAVDDVHTIDLSRDPPATPGQGWVEVFGETADRQTICEALRAGHLYSSTGVELREISVSAHEYRVEPWEPESRVTFIGLDGKELAPPHEVRFGESASYRVQGAEGYVRARIERSDGKRAWTPAVRVVP